MPTTTESTKPITENITNLLSHLIRMPTITGDQATNRAALDWVEEQLHGLPLHIQRLEHNGYPSLVATTKPRNRNPRIWLSGHVDVIPGAPRTFTPRIRDGRIYGRGAHDMKCAIAVFISLLQDMGASLKDYDLGLLLTSDEEIGGYDGVKWLIEEHGYRGGAVLVPDGTDDWQLEIGAKGIMWWDLTSTGRATHASRPWEGVNAIDQLIRFVGELRSHITPEPCGDPEHRHNTLSLGTIHGGTVANQVPETATARIDVRLAPGTDLQTVETWFEQAAEAVPGVEAKPVLSDAPYLVANEGPVPIYRQIAKDVIGRELKTKLALGSSDGRHFGVRGVPVITVRSIGSSFHIADEWADIEDLGNLYEVTHRFIKQWARK